MCMCTSLVPRPLPDFISQPWIFLHGYEIKSGSGLGTRLYVYRCMQSSYYQEHISLTIQGEISLHSVEYVMIPRKSIM